MQSQLIRQDPLLETGFADQFLSQGCRLAIGEQPAWDVATEDVDDDVQLVIDSPGRAQQFGDVPTPELIGGGGHQFRFGMVGMTKLIASFPYFLILLKNAVHRSPGAEVTFLVEQGSVDLARRLIDKTRAVESLSNNRLLLLAQRARRTRQRRRRIYLR